MRLTEGQTIDGRYLLQRRIGSGGMADVWLARDSELGREVAIKVLHDNFARDSEFVDRFRREASAAAGLQHPNVVAVFDRGAVEDSYYIAMEYVEGSTLRDLISRGLGISESVEVTRQVLAAAGFAHERGFVHRDLKPMNVLIDRSGRVRVTDFGIARAGNSEITRTGSVLGTAQYLSPEQAQGFEVTQTSDIYSIGVMLFEMLTGRVPFDGDNAVAIAMKQVSEEPPAPSTINPSVPPALDSVVLKALAKDPAQRYASAAEMQVALDAAEANPEIAGHTERYAAYEAPIEESRWKWWALGALAVLLVGFLIWFFFLRGDDGVRVPGVTGDQVTAATLELQRAGFDVDVERTENPAPEGTVLEQDPRGGERAEEGSTVTLSVSLGPAPVAVPDVVGKTEQQARKKLRKAGFEVEVEERASDSVPAGPRDRHRPRGRLRGRSGGDRDPDRLARRQHGHRSRRRRPRPLRRRGPARGGRVRRQHRAPERRCARGPGDPPDPRRRRDGLEGRRGDDRLLDRCRLGPGPQLRRPGGGLRGQPARGRRPLRQRRPGRHRRSLRGRDRALPVALVGPRDRR